MRRIFFLDDRNKRRQCLGTLEKTTHGHTQHNDDNNERLGCKNRKWILFKNPQNQTDPEKRTQHCCGSKKRRYLMRERERERERNSADIFFYTQKKKNNNNNNNKWPYLRAQGIKWDETWTDRSACKHRSQCSYHGARTGATSFNTWLWKGHTSRGRDKAPTHADLKGGETGRALPGAGALVTGNLRSPVSNYWPY